MRNAMYFHDHMDFGPCSSVCGPRRGPRYTPEFQIRKLPILKSAPWTILSPRRLQMVGCLGYTYSEGMYAYPFKTQGYAMFALEHALKREAK